MDKKPSVIFTINNISTLGSLEILKSHKVKGLNDIPIVGYDDMKWHPPLPLTLTAASQFDSEVAKSATELLYQRILSTKITRRNTNFIN